MVKKVEDLVASTANFLNSHYKLMLFMSLFMYFSRSFLSGLIKGGRWDLYQNIAMADRFLSGQGLYYSAIEASSPYFPGVAFLSIIIGKLFNPWRDYILLFIASVIGTVFLWALIKIGEKFSGNRLISLATTFIIVSIGFDSYRSYMNEFKADSLVLLFGLFIVLIIDKVEKDEWRANLGILGLLFILGFLMDVTKQQALYVDVAVGLYLLFSKKLEIKEKITILSSLVLAGIMDIIVIFSIPDIEIQTIKNLSDMPYWSIKSIIIQMGADFKSNILFFALLFLFAYMLLKRKYEFDSLSLKWFMVALVFGLGQIVGGWKTGGNAGNYEAGMISFLPFVVIAANYSYEEYFVEHKKVIVQGIMNFAICGLCLVIIAWVGYRSKTFVNKVRTDNEVSAYLSKTFGDETIMYYSDQYMQLARSTVKPGMDIYCVPSNMREYMHTREEYIKNQTYKYLYVPYDVFKSWDDSSMTYAGEEVHTQEMLDKYYEPIEDPDMPESLQGQLFVAR